MVIFFYHINSQTNFTCLLTCYLQRISQSTIMYSHSMINPLACIWPISPKNLSYSDVGPRAIQTLQLYLPQLSPLSAQCTNTLPMLPDLLNSSSTLLYTSCQIPLLLNLEELTLQHCAIYNER